ncbi:SCO family protein [Pseudomonadota bacterium]
MSNCVMVFPGEVFKKKSLSRIVMFYVLFCPLLSAAGSKCKFDQQLDFSTVNPVDHVQYNLASHPNNVTRHTNFNQEEAYSRSECDLTVPKLTLKNQNDKNIKLRELVEKDHPVFVQFIFTTCTTICPILTTLFSSVQKELEAIAENYRMISISIDPDYDTSSVLKAYAKRYQGGAKWQFLSGSIESIHIVQKAFDAFYQGNNKMYHQPYTYLRPSKHAPWFRYHGFVSGKLLVGEYKKLSRTNQTNKNVGLPVKYQR